MEMVIIGYKQASSKHSTFIKKILLLNITLIYVPVLSLCFLPGHNSLSTSRRHKSTPLTSFWYKSSSEKRSVTHVQLNRTIVKCSVIWILKKFWSTIFLIFLWTCAQKLEDFSFRWMGKIVLTLKIQKFIFWLIWIHIITTKQTYHISRGIMDNEAVALVL